MGRFFQVFMALGWIGLISYGLVCYPQAVLLGVGIPVGVVVGIIALVIAGEYIAYGLGAVCHVIAKIWGFYVESFKRGYGIEK